MRVLSLFDSVTPMREVDLFVEHPIPFADVHARSVLLPIGNTHVPVASLRDLLTLKRLAGRPHDQADIEALEAAIDEDVPLSTRSPAH